jgi:hypothetical protein
MQVNKYQIRVEYLPHWALFLLSALCSLFLSALCSLLSALCSLLSALCCSAALCSAAATADPARLLDRVLRHGDPTALAACRSVEDKCEALRVAALHADPQLLLVVVQFIKVCVLRVCTR